MSRFTLAGLFVLATLCRAAVPIPEEFFGHRMGADRKLLDWGKVVSYFKTLPASSGNIRVEELGTSTEGRPFIAAIISSRNTLSQLDRFRDIQNRLADPRRTSKSEADEYISQGKTVVMITCSIHATEVASTMSAVDLTYRLLTDNTAKTRAILDNVILILVPSLNPDGVDTVTAWYRKTLGTPFEGTNPPELYHKYVGHDNNRDWYIFSQKETRLAISRLHNVWHPHIVYDMHQQGVYSSRIFVPPWMDPIDPNVDPLIAQSQNAVGAGMAADLTAAGKTGVAINAMYDFWTPSRHFQAYHGGLRILSESASAKLGTPITIRAEELSQSALGYSPRERSWNHLEPWAGGTWRLRDIVDYQMVAMESCLYQAAIRREDFLRNFYAIGKRAVARTVPNAFLIPARQADPGAARALLDTLSFGQVEVQRAGKDFRAGSKNYPAGTYLIPMQQPYSSWAKTLLERQNYPDLRQYPGGPPKRPYDVTAHTLPLLMGVAVETVEESFDASSERITAWDILGEEQGLAASNTDSWKAINALWRAGRTVYRGPSGNFFAEPSPESRELKRPRIGLYKGYVPSMDEGWTRWLLEQFGFSYRSVRNADLQSGHLKEEFDVIIFPDQGSSAIHSGYKPGLMPEEFTGGVGEKGAEALKQFASGGGVLLFLNGACEYAIQHLGAPVKDVLKGVSNSEFYAPGSLLRSRLDLTHQLTKGMPRDVSIWFEDSPAFELVPGARATAIAVYPDTKILSSGWLLGERYLRNRSSLVDVSTGSGHMILFGMRPQYRAQSYLTFKLFFNALLLRE